MSEKLKPCICGAEADHIGDTGFVWCQNPHCQLHIRNEFTAGWWNTRPIEDSLRAERDLYVSEQNFFKKENSDLRIEIARKDEEIVKATHVYQSMQDYSVEVKALRAELARKDEENNKLLNVLWTAEDMVAGWHPNRDSHDKIKELSSAIKSARAAVDEMREGGKS